MSTDFSLILPRARNHAVFVSICHRFEAAKPCKSGLFQRNRKSFRSKILDEAPSAKFSPLEITFVFHAKVK